MTSLRQTLRAAVADALDRAVAAGDLRLPEGAACPRSGSSGRPGRSTATSPPTRPCSSRRSSARHRCRSPRCCAPTGHAAGIARSAWRRPDSSTCGSIRRGWPAASATIREGGPEFGRVPSAEPHRINVEFVSANPTGPLTVGNARGAFVGDLLSRVLEAVGHEVTREYYFNDFNAQVRNLGLSVAGPPRGSRGAGGRLPRRLRAELAREVPDEVWQQAAAPDADPRRGAGPLGIGARPRRHRGQPRRAGRALRRLEVARARCTPRAGSSARSTSCAQAGDMYEAGRRDLVPRPPPSATTRTGSSSAPTGSPPTSRPTSATSPRSSAAASTSWSTSGARTTTARWRATSAAARRWASTRDARAVPADGLGALRARRRGDRHEQAGRRVRHAWTSCWPRSAPMPRAGSSAHARRPPGIDFDIELAKKQSAENPVYYVQYAHARCASILRNAAGCGRRRADASGAGSPPPPSGRAGAHSPPAGPARRGGRCRRAARDA